MSSATVWLMLGCLFLGPHSSQSQDAFPKEMWVQLKSRLLAAGGAEYFEKSVRSAALSFEGTLIASAPSDQPNEFSVAISDDKTPEAILKLKGVLEKPIPLGSPIIFYGIVQAYNRDPFTITFTVEAVNRATVPDKTESTKKKNSK